MLRTQIYLPEDLRWQIDIVARKEKKAAAQVIREMLTKSIAAKHTETAGAALARLAELKVKGGPSDLSVNIDKYLYEK